MADTIKTGVFECSSYASSVLQPLIFLFELYQDMEVKDDPHCLSSYATR